MFLLILACYYLFLAHSFQSRYDWKRSPNLESWYDKYDLCVLRDSTSRPVEEVISQCEKEATSRGEKLKPIRCRIGNSWPTKSGFCSSTDIPYAERVFFQRAPENYDKPNEKPLLDLFTTLAKENSSLLLIGDSVMQQFFAGIACELEREGVWNDPDQFTNTDEIKLVSIDSTLPSVPVRFLPIYHFVNSRFDRVANASMHNLRKGAEEFLSRYDGVTILINMGLHYVSNPVAHFTRLDYQSQMTIALHYLHELSIKDPKKKVRVIWRETSAQHFPTSNGYWPGVRYASSMKLACVPINDTSPGADWRNEDVAAIIRANKFNIRIIPYYEVTLPLYSMHVNGHMRDCTHFCWSPMLYQSLFHDLANVVKY